MFAHDNAFAAAITFFPKHGASTRFAIGSHTSPIMLCNAIDAAASDCSKLPPANVTKAAAAMLAADPPSA